MIVHLVWLLLVILWNFGFPNAHPLSDVVVAIILSYISNKLSYYFISNINTEKNITKNEQYWKDNIQLILRCLLIWFLVSYVFGIILVQELNLIRFGGYKLGFWFAQQGSIFTFVFLIFYYSFKIGKIDDKYKNLKDE